MMVDLLQTQDYIERASLYDGESVDYDWDRFRRDPSYPINSINIINAINSIANEITGAFLGGGIKELRQRIVPQMELDFPSLTGTTPVCQARWM